MRNIKKLQRALQKLPVHPSFILLLGWFLFVGKAADFLLFCFVVLSHELGHYLTAKKLGYKLDKFVLAPYGVSLSFQQGAFEQSDEVKIALAGPLTNIALAFFTVALWWIVPASFNYSQTFVLQSLSLALFNLLPAYPLDGGRVFVSLLGRATGRERAIRLSKAFNIVFSIAFFALFVASCLSDFNPTFALAAVFTGIAGLGEKNQCNYKLLALLKKQNKGFSKPLLLYADSRSSLKSLLKHIPENRYTVFYVSFDDKTRVLDEKIVAKLALSYPLDTSLQQIYKNKPR